METQSVIVYRSKWDQQIDEYKPEIMMGFGAIILLLFLAMTLQDWWQARKARKQREKLQNSVGLDNKNRGW